MAFKKSFGVFIRALLLLLIFVEFSIAEHLPITVYTTREGLSHNRIKWIHQDEQGFLWIGTTDGLSRFDGSGFLNFNLENGLPHPTVNFLFRSRDGNYWIATNGGGVCTFNPSLAKTSSASDKSHFIIYRLGTNEISNKVNVLHEDHLGRIWAGTDEGMYRYDPLQKKDGFRLIEIGLIKDHSEELAVTSIIEDRRGAIWIGTGGSGVFRIFRNGKIERFASQQGFPSYPTIVWALAEDKNGMIWAGTSHGIYQLLSDLDSNGNIVANTYLGFDDSVFYVRALRRSPDNKIWLGTNSGLFVYDGTRFTKYTTAHGLSQDEITSITFDKDNDIWLGTSIGGLNKIAANGFTTFDKQDGLENLQITSFFENNAGDLFATSSNWMVHRFDGFRFSSIRPRLPSTIFSPGWWWQQNTLLATTGEWWFATNNGLFRFSATKTKRELANLNHQSVFTVKNGLVSDHIQTLFEDAQGDLWISSTTSNRTGLSRLEKSTGKLHHYSSANGLPNANWPSAFCEDRNNNIWIGFYYGGLARYKNGNFQFFSSNELSWPGSIRRLYTDRRGWLWIATEHSGVRCLRNPNSNELKFTSYTTEQGLSSNNAWCFIDYDQDRMFIGTSRGLDSLNLATNTFRNYSIADGLPDNFVQTAFRDRKGTLWFGTPKGISRFAAASVRNLSLPKILISDLKIAGVSYPLSVSGESQISDLILNPGQNNLEIHFSALNFHAPDQLRFRHRIKDTEEKWSFWSNQNTVHYAKLAPGEYIFEAQAKNVDGGVSVIPARITFAILKPYWQRWWFISLALGLMSLLVYSFYRYRVFHLLRLERVRTQIASDLHDDIGLSLSHIAVLSEVLRKKARNSSEDFSESLSKIARISREAVDSMSDIVWAVNPQKDRVMDLERRMHHAANEILFAQGIIFSFQATGHKDGLRVATNVRREVLMIFKESLNNIVRHSGCSKVQITLSINRRELLLKVADDGKGFNLNPVNDGNGLLNMRKRSRNVNGDLKLESTPGSGTKMQLTVPLN